MGRSKGKFRKGAAVARTWARLGQEGTATRSFAYEAKVFVADTESQA